ncbi:MAG: hypothetical protein ABI867_26585 [Kofleriaceae bacterium]
MTRHVVLGLLVTVGVLATAAHAGLTGSYPVTINPGQAMGGIATARSAQSSNTHIGCSTTVTVNGGPASYYGYCQARDNSGVNAMCVTHEPELVLMMARAQTDARIHFSWDSRGNCTSIGLDQSSTQAPKAP